MVERSKNGSWGHQLLSDVNPTFQDLAESYNQFLFGSNEQELPVPGNLLVDIGKFSLN